jgi:hypothetical protein
MITMTELRAEQRDGAWLLAGPGGHPDDLRLCNDYLGYLADRHYAAGTRRSYAFDLLAFARWLAGQQLRLEAVDTGALLRFLAWCRSDGLAAATVNRRMAALSGLFAFRSMRDPSQVNPMPKGAAARRATGSQRDGLLGHLARPQPRSAVRVRQPRRLPRGLDRAEVLRQPSEEVLHLLRFPAPHGAPAPRGAVRPVPSPSIERREFGGGVFLVVHQVGDQAEHLRDLLPFHICEVLDDADAHGDAVAGQLRPV